MSKGQMAGVVQHLRGLAASADADGPGDGALLERFLSGADEAAFEALVRRHGPMVWGVCRRVLSDPHDAEDAFQATFLVLVRKAAGIARRDLLGNWLYGVAYHTARAARAAAGRRRAKEAKAVPRSQPPDEPAWQDLRPLLDEEVSRLPDRLRAPVVLCDLEGKGRREAARALGVAEGTLSSRLARARALLRRRLTRRGVTLAAGAVAAGLAEPASALPPALVSATVRAGTLLLANPAAAAGAVSARVAALSEGVLRTMFLTKLKLVAAVLVLGGALALGVGAAFSQRPAGAEPAAAPRRPAAPARPEAAPLLRQALAVAKDIDDPEARVRTLVLIAKAQDTTGDAAGARKTRQKAVQAAREIAVGRVKAQALVGVALAHAEAGDRAAAMNTLRQADQAATAITDAHARGNALLWLVRAQAHLGDYEGGWRSVTAGGAYRASLLWALAEPLRTEDRAAARKVLRKAEELARAVESPPDRGRALAAIAGAQARSGDTEAALRTAEAVGGPWKAGAQAAVAAALAKAGDVAGALRAAKSIGPAEQRAQALLAVAAAQAKAGDRAAAEVTVKDVRRIADDLAKKPPPRGLGPAGPPVPDSLSRVLGRLAVAQVRVGDVKGATETADGIRSLYEKARALLEIGAAQVEAGERKGARQTLRGAARAAEQIPPVLLRGPPAGQAATLRQVTTELARAGDVPEAIRTAERITSPHERDTARAQVAGAQAEAGDVKGALESVAAIRDGTWKAYALEQIARARVKAGDERGALALAAAQTSPYLKAAVLLGAARGYARK